MIETAKVGFYNITACGYFKRKLDVAAFGDITGTLTQLQQWAKGKLLEDTKIFEPDDESDALPCYLVDIQGGQDSWVITTWNETPTHAGKVASIEANSSVGSANVVLNEVKKGSIPGFATYFWIIPSRAKVATVRFEHAAAGQKSFQLYLQAFLDTCSPHVRKKVSADGKIEIVGYSKTVQDKPAPHYPRFRTEIYQKPGEHQFLLNSADKIRRVHRKTALDLRAHQTLAGYQKVLTVLGLRKPAHHTDTVHVHFDADVRLSQAEVQAIISEWKKDHDREWDDYGFDISGENKVFWISRSFARDTFDLEVTREHEALVQAGSLLDALNANKDKILAIL